MNRAIWCIVLAATIVVVACSGSGESVEPTPASTAHEIAFVDLYGLRNVSPQAVREAIGENPEVSERLVEKLQAIPGVSGGSFELVCCVEGKNVLFVGIVEPSSPPPPPTRPRPDEETRLPPEFGQAYAEFLEALLPAVEAGRGGEDRSEGHALSEDPAMRAAQEKFIELSRDHVELLREVLASSRYDEDRAVAAHVIAYVQDKAAVLPDLLHAASDADSTVRNNAIRAIGVLAYYAENKPDILQRIDPEPFIAMLSSPEWSDRNKAIGVLLGLTKQRDPRWAERFRGDAVSSLAEMARWQSPSHAYDAFDLLGRMVGLSDEEIVRAWSASDRDGWIDEAVAKARRD